MNRFLVSIALSLLFLSSCGKVEPARDIDPPKPVPVPEQDGTIRGAVSDENGTPLPGVVVSDGQICCVTDSKGKYSLDSGLQHVDFVFVSTPGGYVAPVSGSRPVFYKRLSDCRPDASGVYSNVDFTLRKLERGDRFTMIIAADPQPRKSSSSYDKIGYHSLDCVDDMFREMKENAAGMSDRYVCGLVLGDVCHNDCTLFPTYLEKMKDAGFPVYHVIGNHDHDLNKAGDRESSSTFESYFGPTNYSFNLGNCHIVVLDNMMAISSKRATNSGSDVCPGLRDDIYQWLVNDLSYVDRSKTIMICTHGPMFKTMGGGTATRNNVTYDGKSCTNHYADVDTLIAKYPKVYAWAGHTHYAYNYVSISNPKVETHTLARTCGQLWTNEWEDGGTPRGYTVLECDGGAVSWKFHPIKYQSGTCMLENKPIYKYRDWDYEGGVAVMKSDHGKTLDESYQMHVYAPGSFAPGDKLVYVNVFLWDELWKLPKLTCNGVTTEMKRSAASNGYKCAECSSGEINAWYKQHNALLNGESYSADADWSTSVFSAPCDLAHGTATVSVEDRFGNIYKQSVTW